LKFGLRDGRFVFDQFTLQRADSAFNITGYAELTGTKRLDVRLRGELEAALLQVFVAGMRADGHVNVTGGVTGTLSDPRFTGTTEIQDASVRFTGFPQVFEHINGTLVFKSDRIEIDSLKMNVGGGTVVAGGYMVLEGLVPKNVRLNLQGTDVALRYFEGLTIDGDFNIVVSGDAKQSVITGDVNVKRGLYFKDVDFSQAILNVVLSRRTVTPIVAASWQDHVALRLHVAAPGTLAVRNNIADLTGTADLDVSGTLANPVVSGLVTLNEGGKVRFQNIDYRLVRGSITFQNPFRIDPYFDVTMEARVNGGLSEIEAGPLDVTVTLTGTLDRISPTITSDPPASDITLFSLLGLGGLTTSNSQSTAPFNASLAGRSLLYQQLSRTLGQKVLPFADTFSYDPGTLDTTGDPGPKFTFEKRLSNSVDLFVVYSVNDAKNKEVVEWQVTPDWTLQVTRDQLAGQYRVEARFRRRYEAHWMLGRRPSELFEIPSVSSSFSAPPPVVVSTIANTTPPLPAPATATANAEPAFEELPILSVSLSADAKFDLEALREHLAFKAGERLTVRNMQKTIKTLYATGDFRDVRVNADVAAGGVNVMIVLSLNYRVAEVNFDGLGGEDRNRAERDVNFRRGDVLSLNAVDRSAVALQEELGRDGYLNASVDPETNFDRATSQALIIFHVTRSTRAHIGQVIIDGNTAPYTAQQLIGEMRRGPGRAFRIDDARSDAGRMHRFLVRNEYRKANVSFISNTVDPATKLVTLRYLVETGPKVRIAVKGPNPRFVRRLLPFRKNQGYSEDVIEKAAEDITAAYQQRGFYHATVDTETTVAANTSTTTFNINPGQEYKLTAVTFTGNARESDKALANVVTTSPHGGFFAFLGSLFGRGHGVTQTQLSADRDALESYYRLNGFSEATVATPIVSTSGDLMTVDFPITEGPQTILTAVAVEGNEQVPSKDLPPLHLHSGDPLNPQLERADIVALQSYYADRGNAEVQVQTREDVSQDKTTAKLAYVLAEGPKIKIGDVAVRGNTYTNTSVVRRQAQVDKGDPFSYTSLLEAQRNLYRLGIFQRVDVQPEQAGTSLAERNVAISVEEGKDLTVSGSVGASTVEGGGGSISPRVAVSVAHRNLFGTGRYLGLEVIRAEQDQNEVFLTYREPFIGHFDIPVQFTVFQNDQIRRNVPVQERGASIEASRVEGLHTRFALRYEYRISNCTVKQTDDLCDRAQKALIPGLDRSFTNVSISSLTPTFFWDRRDDAFDPHHGFFTTASVEYAFKTFRADAEFLKESVQASWYLPLSQKSVFALSGRIGLIQPLGGVNPDTGLRGGVPLTEKFTAGGDSSHRAYAQDLLGTICVDPNNAECVANATLIRIAGTNNTSILAPIGGNSMFIMNAEYRFPIAGPIGGTLFVDAGNTFAQTNISFGDLRYGVGTGLRYLSPVGPVRFDVGYKLRRQVIGFDNNQQPIFERPFAYFITLGYAF
jgi:outer membrane protein insertion porin family